LTLPYLFLVGGYVASVRLVPFSNKVVLGTFFSCFGFFALIAVSLTAIDVWGVTSGVNFGLGDNALYVLKNLPSLLFSMILITPAGLLILYLFLNFFSFYLFIPLAFYPFFFIYLLPIVLLTEKGVFEGIRRSFDMAWKNFQRTAIITFIPAIIIGYIISFSLYEVVFLFFLPIWVVLVTRNFYSISECDASTGYFTSVNQEK
jgi:hypothetical protein